MRNFSIQIIAAIGLVLTLILATFFSLAPQAASRSSNPFGNILSNLAAKYEATKTAPKSESELPTVAPNSPQTSKPAPIEPAQPASPASNSLRWIEPPKPTRWDYPLAAQESRSTGRVTLNCAIDGSGHPSTCRVISEVPSGMGFGQSALSVAARAKASAPNHSGPHNLTAEMVFPPAANTPKTFPQRG